MHRQTRFSLAAAVMIVASSCAALEGRLDFNNPQMEALDKAIVQAYKVKNYARMEQKCNEYLKSNPLNYNVYYSLANAELLQGKREPAFTHLQKAAELGFYQADHMKTDKDLEPMHGDKRWDEMVKKVEQNYQIQEVLPDAIRKALEAKDYKKVLSKCDELVKLDPQASVHRDRARALAMLNSKDDAFAALEKAVDEDLKSHIVASEYTLKDPLLASLTADKRFAALMDKTKAREASWNK